MQTVIYILATAWKRVGRLGQIFWGLGFVAPLALSTQSGRLQIPILGEAANALPWWGWIFSSFLIGLVFLLIQIGQRARELEEYQKPSIDVGLASPIEIPRTIIRGTDVSIKIKNNGSNQLRDVKCNFLKAKLEKDQNVFAGSKSALEFLDTNNATAVSLNPGDEAFVCLGHVQPVDGAINRRLTLPGGPVGMRDQVDLFFDLSASDVARRVYRLTIQSQSVKRDDKEFRNLHIGVPTLAKNAPR